MRRKDVVTSLSYQDVCYSKDSGYIEYNGLPGKLKAGCPHTPELKSQFCALHKQTAVIPKEIQRHMLYKLSNSKLSIIVGMVWKA